MSIQQGRRLHGLKLENLDLPYPIEQSKHCLKYLHLRHHEGDNLASFLPTALLKDHLHRWGEIDWSQAQGSILLCLLQDLHHQASVLVQAVEQISLKLRLQADRPCKQGQPHELFQESHRTQREIILQQSSMTTQFKEQRNPCPPLPTRSPVSNLRRHSERPSPTQKRLDGRFRNTQLTRLSSPSINASTYQHLAMRMIYTSTYFEKGSMPLERTAG